MHTLRVNDVLKDRILVSRESARLLEDPLRAMMLSAKTQESTPGASAVAVDFQGVEGIAPSFLDELLLIFESILGTETSCGARCLIVANPPTRLSLKFEAIARGHGKSVQALADGSWSLADAGDSGA